MDGERREKMNENRPYCYGFYKRKDDCCKRCGFKVECFTKSRKDKSINDFWRESEAEGIHDDYFTAYESKKGL